MSKEILDMLVGLALIDPAFSEQLLAYPLQTALSQGFELTSAEQEILQQIRADDLYDFSKQVLKKLSSVGECLDVEIT